jgi:hypothetical protein
MKLFRTFKVAIFLGLIAIGLGGSLTGCLVDDGFRGGHERR